MNDLERLAARAEIDDLLTRYTLAVDAWDFERLGEVFTPDAVIDYTGSGGIAGSLPEVQAWLAEALAMASHMQHLIGQREVVFDGLDAARLRAYFWNPMRIALPDSEPFDIEIGGVYEHDLVRTPEGWRSRRLVERQLWRR
jgi:hypothetical protein